MEIYVIIFILIVVFGIFLIHKFSKTKKISSSQKAFIIKNYKKISANIDYKSQIIDYDKLYHKILQEAGYHGTFGEILKQKPIIINDLNKIWELHKIRNKLVHDFDLMSEGILKQKAMDYSYEIKYLIKQIT